MPETRNRMSDASADHRWRNCTIGSRIAVGIGAMNRRNTRGNKAAVKAPEPKQSPIPPAKQATAETAIRECRSTGFHANPFRLPTT